MLVSDLLSPERVLLGVRATSKKKLLELISSALVQRDPALNEREVFESLCARERLGSTGLGHGIAIPHGRVNSSAVPQAVFMRLAKPLHFDAVDSQPVDLLFALAVPEHCTSEHLNLLAQIAERFSDPELLGRLRKTEDAGELVQLLSDTKH